MSEVCTFPSEAIADPARRLTVAQHLRAGPKASVSSNGEALSRWFRFDAEAAAISCATCATFEEAVRWWSRHIAEARTALRGRGLGDEKIAAILREYTARVRTEFKAFRARQMSSEELAEEALYAAVSETVRTGGADA